MKIIFLDVDGVLNRCGASSQGLEEDKLLLLKQIIHATGAKVVISSTWRKIPRQLHRLCSTLLSYDADIIGSTPVLDTKEGDSPIIHSKSRGEEIQAWLNTHPNPDQFIIIDDGSDMGTLSNHLVQTNSYSGLTRGAAKLAIALLGAK